MNQQTSTTDWHLKLFNEFKLWTLAWVSFFRIACTPQSIILLLLILGLIAAQVLTTNGPVQIALAIILSLFSGVLGSKWNDEAIARDDSKIAVIKGKSAIRSLKIQIFDIGLMESGIRKRLASLSPKQIENAVESHFLSNLLDRCRSIQEQVVLSIENWTDLGPDADVKTQIGMISDLSSSVEEKSKEIDRVKQDLKDAQEDSKDTVESLQKKMRGLEEERDKAREELRRKELTFDTSINFGLNSASGFIGGIGSTGKPLLGNPVGTTLGDIFRANGVPELSYKVSDFMDIKHDEKK